MLKSELDGLFDSKNLEILASSSNSCQNWNLTKGNAKKKKTETQKFGECWKLFQDVYIAKFEILRINKRIKIKLFRVFTSFSFELKVNTRFGDLNWYKVLFGGVVHPEFLPMISRKEDRRDRKWIRGPWFALIQIVSYPKQMSILSTRVLAHWKS